MHNLLITLTALMLAGASVLGYLNKEKLTKAKATLEEDQKSLKSLAEKATKATQGVLAEKAALQAATAEKARLVEQIQAKEKAIEEKDQQITGLGTEISDRQAELLRLEQEIEKIGGIEETKAKIAVEQQKNSSLKGQQSSLSGQKKSMESEVASLQTGIESKEKELEGIEKGKMPPELRATIKGFNPDWGYVTISAGTQQGVGSKGLLSVQRGGLEIARVKVAELFRNSAVADVVPGSIAAGMMIQRGDRVVPVQPAGAAKAAEAKAATTTVVPVVPTATAAPKPAASTAPAATAAPAAETPAPAPEKPATPSEPPLPEPSAEANPF